MISLQFGKKQSDDMALVFDVCFNYDNKTNTTMVNDKVDNVWGPEKEISESFPFAPDELFDMVLVMNADSVNVGVDLKNKTTTTTFLAIFFLFIIEASVVIGRHMGV